MCTFVAMKALSTFILIAVVFVIYSCNAPNQLEQQRLDFIEALKSDTENINYDTLYQHYLDFAHTFPDNPRSASFLYSAGMHFANQNQTEVAANAFKKYFYQYPDSTQSSNSLLNAAFLFEHIDPKVAIDLYKKFINTFPDDERTPEVKQNMRFVGKPAEYILEELKKQNPDLGSEEPEVTEGQEESTDPIP